MNQTAELFDLDNVRRFRKFWGTCSEIEQAEIYKIIRQEIDGEIEENLSKKQLDEQADKIIDFLNLKTGRNFRKVETHKRNIRARLQSGITIQQMKAIIVKKTRDWKGTDQEEYLRPATLFCEKNCENYLGGLG